MLPTNKQDRKERPIARGVLDYFPDAIAAVAHTSFVGNCQHNPGEEMHWAREKSADHADCIVRHLMERGTLDDDGIRHSAKVAWRALAMLQLEIEARQQWDDAHADAGPPPTHSDFLDNVLRENPVPVSRPANLQERLLIAKQVSDTGFAHNIGEHVASGVSFPGRVNSPDTVDRRLVYIAGPMRNVADFNFPAFDRARDLFCSHGWATISPADIDRNAPVKYDGSDEVATDSKAQRVYAYRDIASLFIADAIAMLPGWELSTGASAEHRLAKWLDLPILNAETMTSL